METLIVICLLVVIVLLLQDKGIFTKKTVEETKKERGVALPDIIGVPKEVKRLSVPMDTSERHAKKQENVSDNFDTEIDADAVSFETPQEEPEEVFAQELDYELEEEELRSYRVSDDDESGYATGVTFEELSAVQMVLQQKELEPSLQKQAVEIVHRIQGTELFSLLENSMEGASRRIAELLEKSLSTKNEPGSSNMRKENLEGFDIGDFV